jgi:hypothetical protein
VPLYALLDCLDGFVAKTNFNCENFFLLCMSKEFSAKSGTECNQSALELLAEAATRTHDSQSSITKYGEQLNFS